MCGGNVKLIKLDYTIKSPEERNELVKKILEENPEPNEAYLEILANYLVLAMEKEEKRQRKILTDNRLTTVNKRETSYEGLISQLENGEDGIYSLISEDKQIIFQPKVTITKKDVEEIPDLKQLKEAITNWENILKTTEGKPAYTIKKALIEMRKDQYIIKNSYRRPIVPNKLTHSKSYIHLDGMAAGFDEEGYPIPSGVSLLDPKICSAILCNYSKLKETGWGNLSQILGSLWNLLMNYAGAL